MPFTAYRRAERQAYSGSLSYKVESKGWVLDCMYCDGMPGGKKREREYAKTLEQAGCKIEWVTKDDSKA